MPLTKFLKLRTIYTGRKCFSVADMLNRNLIQWELQLNQVQHKQSLPQIHSATVTYDNQLNLGHCLIKHVTVLPSQKDDCHPNLDGFGKKHSFIRIVDKEGNIIIKPIDSFSFEVVEPFQKQYKKQSKENTKTVLQQSAIFNEADITNNDDPIEKRIPRNDFFLLIFQCLLSHLPLEEIKTLKTKVCKCKWHLKHL